MTNPLQRSLLLSGFVVAANLLSGCNQEPFLNAGATAIFNPQLDVTDTCPLLRLKVDSGESPSISGDFSPANISGSGYTNGYALRGYPSHTSQKIFSPKITLQCVKNGNVVGESIRNMRPVNDTEDTVLSVSIHISAPKPDQTYVGTYVSRTGFAPVIEIGPEITAPWR
ncbi:hypothetical protein FNU79_13405 [Deinococcus detaillensis]|uniref:Lipoprotein n=1 Tax=Deinococcus detaillensis TaxID=2592048 RepID=A0A553UQR2_9DEIO|nr:hypothetical protein [Deinococcus detaillensis]TSA82560.1 hypothetical protein FNU79_13405 [Deinococcus detaillensis]